MLNIGAKSRNANTGTGQVSHQYIHTVFLVTGSMLLTLTLMEVTLRLFSGLLPVEIQQVLDINPRNFGVSHPYVGYLHKPKSSFTSSGRDFKAVHHTDGHGFLRPHALA